MAARLSEDGSGTRGVGRAAPSAEGVEGIAQLPDLAAVEVGEEVPADAVDVHGRRSLERGEAGVGEHRQRDPAVGGARLACDEPEAHEAVEAPGEAARRQMEAN